MNPRSFKSLLAFCFIGMTFIISGCSFVDSLPGSELVVMSNQTEQCTKLGETRVSVLSTIAGFDRDEDVMSEELITMARNAAFEQGGNTISQSTEVEDGTQSFGIFRCR
jgi:Domain of unknown function (DUF4156)